MNIIVIRISSCNLATMKKLLLSIFLLPLMLISQEEHLKYRSAENPEYWKNRKPHAAYWQQDVHYNLIATIDDKTDIVSGEEELTYWNNSPDELPFVFFHLYSNAQTKDSYLADLYKNNNYKLKFGKYRKEGLGTAVESIQINGKDLKTELDNTVMKVQLLEPLKPGESVTFKIKFKTYFDKEAIRNRMKLFNSGQYKHYDLVHWYPRISVYDQKFGWDTEQHMDHEFYGDFGSFHVELTMQNNYVGDGTGVHTNENEIFTDEEWAKLDIKNFKTKAWNSAPSEVIKPDGTTRTWKFSSINTHDAAYTFDPTYRIGVSQWNGIKCVALAQESHAAGWQYASVYVAKIIEINSKNIGLYVYPKMITADAQDGMEYPMLTLDGGYDPDFISLFIHEISHNWFFGMVGTNETYRSCMDEGFTQFYTSDTYENMIGRNEYKYVPKKGYVAKYTKPSLIRESEVYNRYYNSVAKGEENTLNTHSDGYNGAIRQGGGYGIVYSKMATMLYNLEYVLGDSLFDAAMQHYFSQWKMAHPYMDDFRNSIIQFTKVDLNWFFDEWLETSKTIDYKVGKVKLVNRKTHEYEITFKRKGSMQMPIDFSVSTHDSGIINYHIPNNWFVKNTKAKVLPRWIGWDKVKKTYTAKIRTGSRITHVAIDTTNRLADVNMINNAKKRNIHVGFDSKIYHPADRKTYEMFARPALWYNGYDGIKIGANLNGHYLNYKHVLDATVWFNTGVGQNYLDTTASVLDNNVNNDAASFLINYRTSTEKFMKKSTFIFSARELDGLSSGTIGFEKLSNSERNKFYLSVKSMLRDVDNDLNYLIYRDQWQLHKLNNYTTFGWTHTTSRRKSSGSFDLRFRAPVVFSDYDYSTVAVTWINNLDLGKINFVTRFFAQYGHGYNIPDESALFAAGANAEELMENKFTRAMGIYEPFNFGAKTNNFAAGGGLNLRGYMGYLLVEKGVDGIYRYNYKGTTGSSFNVEMEFGELIRFNPRFLKNMFTLKPYLFGDIGTINTNFVNELLVMSEPIADAGAGVALTINHWFKLQTAKPLTIRADFPVFINRLPAVEKDYLQFRFVIGISRAF